MLCKDIIGIYCKNYIDTVCLWGGGDKYDVGYLHVYSDGSYSYYNHSFSKE